MHNCVTSHLWLKSALHASSHPCMCTLCVASWLFSPRLSLFSTSSTPFSFQPFQMFTSVFNERFRSNPLCDFRLGTVATSDHETPLTGYEPKQDSNLVNTEELDLAATQRCLSGSTPSTTTLPSNDPDVDDNQLGEIPCSCGR